MENKGMAAEYKKLIIDMVGRIDDERFLCQVYTIVIRYIRRAGR